MALTWSPCDDEGWREEAACRHTSSDLYFPVGITGTAVPRIQEAKTVCRSCPVQDQCLGFAIETNQEYGIWGGTTEDERRGLRQAWRRGLTPRERSSVR